MIEGVDESEVREEHRKAARRIAAELLQSPHDELLAKATTLLHAFKHDGRSARMPIVERALAERELTISPTASMLEPTGLVGIKGGVRQPDRSRPWIRGFSWNSHDLGEPFDVTTGPSRRDGVQWYDIEPVSGELVSRRVREASELIQDRCSGLLPEMIKRVLEEDSQPKVETFGRDDSDVRAVSIVAVIARETDDTQQLIFQTVELLVGPQWIVSCWHDPSTHDWPQVRTGSPERIALLKEPFLSHVRYRWSSGSGERVSGPEKTSGDLGVYLARALVDTYEATNRMMERWLSQWEVSFSKALSESAKNPDFDNQQAQISSYLHMAAEVHRRLTALQHAKHSAPDRTWFAAVAEGEPPGDDEIKESTQVAKLQQGVDSALENLKSIKDDIRTNINQLILQSSTALQHSSAKLEESSRRVQEYITLITGLVLVPTLVVGLFGANTRLPGRDTWLGFELMVALMAASGIIVYLVIRRLKRNQE